MTKIKEVGLLLFNENRQNNSLDWLSVSIYRFRMCRLLALSCVKDARVIYP